MSGGDVLPAGRGAPPDAPHEGGGLEQLAEELRRGLDGLGAHAGGLFLLNPEHVLELTVLVGIPREFAGPWERVGLTTPMPLADPVRTGELVWVSGQEGWMRRYPRIAVAVPYDFSLAAVPVRGGHRLHGSVFALWPGTQPASIPDRLRNGMWSIAADAGHALDRAAPGGHRPGPGPGPGDGPLVWSAPSPAPGSAAATERMFERLPEGVFALDIHGLVTAVTPHAARLLDTPASRLIGTRPWEALPWLRDPLYDRFRGAVISGLPFSGTGLRPPGTWLDFEVYPSRSGVSVRVTPTPVGRAPEAPPPEFPGLSPVDGGALYHVLHLATALTEAIGVRDVVDLVADELMPAYGGQALAILVSDGDRLRVVGHRGHPSEVVARYDDTQWVPSEPGALTLRSGQPGFYESIADLDRDFPHRAGVHDGMASWAMLPLIASGRHIGTCVFAYAQPHRFSATERAVLTSLGGLIAQALDRARLYDKKLALARGLQDGLLPHALPAVPGLATAARYLPGTEGMDIGGDFYDLVRLRRDSAAAVIGDVQGHNVTAAALMGQIRTAVHAYATADASPGEVLAGTNRLLADLDSGLFASCACLRLDPYNHVARLASAGHPYPLVRSPDGTVRALSAPGGLLLGIEADSAYPQTEFPMPPGTTIALYTDGLIETPGVDLDEALAGLSDELAHSGNLPVEQLADTLIARTHATGPRTDDIALLLLRAVPGDSAGAG
ncbi:SpoIIE family protein phosphatase [Streptomyces pathocidini]|uniref:SpoIIE family protein phosphatase n=1 Tax=Streptomyces pathocidini TaxID=1650571 RepID=UPI0033F86326